MKAHGAVATRPLAAPGADPQRRSRRRTGDAPGAADVGHRGLGTEQDATHPGITGEALHGGGGDRPGELELTAGSALETHHRLHRGGELEVGAYSTGAGDRSQVEGVQGDLHQGVGEAPGQRAVIAGAGGFGQREDGGLEGGRGDGIEVATQGKEPTLTGDELTAVALGGADRLGEDRGGVVGVASLGAVVAEAAHRVFPGELQESALVEGKGRRGRCRDRRDLTDRRGRILPQVARAHRHRQWVSR